MKKSLKNAICLLALVAITAPSFGANQIGSTLHNFADDTWADNKPCSPCHTPHASAVQTAPLWNHAISTQSFTMYTSAVPGSDLDGTVDADPSGTSLLCLSCHDGVTDMSDFGGSTPTGTDQMTGSAVLGITLTSTHPIGITYNDTTASADGALHDPTVALSGLGGTITADMLVSGKVECSSCHDVHGDVGIAKLLRKNMTGDALCITCHNK